ncbi:MAG: DsbA family protein [Pseudomonadaceae bacterium]|nr:DsbA family protein [Pseudomonadaceae bacterium]
MSGEQLALSSDAPLIVYIDYKSPYAYLAIGPTYHLLDELAIEADWRPLTLDIVSYAGSAKTDGKGQVLKSERSPKQWQSVKYAYRDCKRYARARGLELLGTTKIWDSSLAGIGLLWCKQYGQQVTRRYTELTYQRFWIRELDIEDASVVSAVVNEAGAPVEGFADFLMGDGRAQHDALQEPLLDCDIYGVPTFVIPASGDAPAEVFFGREHLPMVRWLLTGQPGPAPDVAYERLGADY